jgi:membrane associated rhomboid family serine protease
MVTPSDREILQALKGQILILGGLIGLLWIIHIVNISLFNGALIAYGIFPRQLDGLQGILWAPLLHGSFRHLLTNTLPLLTLGWLILLQGTRTFLVVTAIAALISGLGTWLIGAPASVHIGASGVAFGYVGYLLFRGYFDRSPFSITLAIIVVIFYGGFIWGLLPSQPGVSWEGHLSGFMGGGLAARSLTQRSV